MINTSPTLKVLAGTVACFLLGCSSPQAKWVSVWKMGAPYSHLISDPLAWSATQFLDSPIATVGDAQLETFEADIDHDGIPELFVTSATTRGNAGASWLVFRTAEHRFAYIGEIGLKRESFRVLPLGADHRPRLLVYWRHGGGEGTLAVLTNDGRAFRTVSSEVIHPDDSGTEEGRRKYEDAFGKETPNH